LHIFIISTFTDIMYDSKCCEKNMILGHNTLKDMIFPSTFTKPYIEANLLFNEWAIFGTFLSPESAF